MSTRGAKTVTSETVSSNTEEGFPGFVFEVHIHDHDGCYDLFHHPKTGEYKRKMFVEGNFLKNPDKKCAKSEKIDG